MAKKLFCLENFHCSDQVPAEKGDKEGAKRVFRHWKKGEEYTGSDDQDRLQDEGLIGEEEDAPKPVKKKAAKGKKSADELAEGEGMTVGGDELPEGKPADGTESDGEEEAEEAPARPARGKGGKKKKS